MFFVVSFGFVYVVFFFLFLLDVLMLLMKWKEIENRKINDEEI